MSRSSFSSRPVRGGLRRFLAIFLPLVPVAAIVLLGSTLLGAAGSGTYRAGVRITELCAKNLTGLTDADGTRSDWLELTNLTGQDIDLSGWHLSDSTRKPEKYTLPDGFTLPAGSAQLFWADGQDRTDASGAVHLNFSLDGQGGTLVLSDAAGNEADRLVYPEQQWDLSFGRRALDLEETGFFGCPTPGSLNGSAFLEVWSTGELNTEVIYSTAPGRYDAPFALTLTAQDPEALILYTTDGSDPMESGQLFCRALTIENPSGEENRYVSQACLNDSSPVWLDYTPEPVEKCTVVKARAYKDGKWGPLCAATYWVGTQVHTLPVVSVSGAPQDLFGNEGIYTAGATYYTSRKYNMDLEYPGNNTSGKEIAATVEIFDTDGTRLVADTAKIKVSGEASRALTVQKSLNVDLDSETYAMNIDGVSYDLHEFTLRGTGCGATYFSAYQDAFLNNYLDENAAVDLGAQHNIPVVLYLEGEYWGIYTIREKKTGALLERHYGVDGSKTVWLGGSETAADAESISAELTDRVNTLDCHDPDDLAWVEATFDMDNILSFMVCNLFTNNFDGALVPNHNVILWKTSETDPDNPYADGRWRALVNDLDVTFTDPESRHVPEENRLKNLIEDDTTYGNSYTMIPKTLVHRLWGNEEFRMRFVRTCVEEMASTYAPEQMLPALESWRAALAPEQPANLKRLERQPSEWAALYPLVHDSEPDALYVTPADWDGIMDQLTAYVAARRDALTADLWTWCPEEMAQLNLDEPNS